MAQTSDVRREESHPHEFSTREGTFVTVFALPFMATGVWAVWSAPNGMARYMGALFFAAGAGIFLFGRYLVAQAHENSALQARSPDQPWMWRADWARGRVHPRSRTDLIAIGIFTGFWNAFSIAAAFEEPMALLFVAIGMIFLVWTLRITWRWLRFRDSVFELSTLPGVIGGRLAGTVHIGTQLLPEDGFRVALTCLRPQTRGSHERVLWQEERTIGLDRLVTGPLGTALPIEFTIPYDCEATPQNPDNRHLIWSLEVKGTARGINYASIFEVPIFATRESSPEVRARDAAPEHSREPEIEASPRGAAFHASSKIRVQALPDGRTVVVFPAARNKRYAIWVTCFTTVWSAFVYLFAHAGGQVLPFVIAAGGLALFLIWQVLELWLRRIRVEAHPGGLDVKRSMLWMGRTRHVAAHELERIDAVIRKGSGNPPYYDIKAHRPDLKPLTLGDRIRSKREAEWVARTLWQAVKGPPSE